MKEEYFWSIVIEQELVQAALWTVRADKVAILSTSTPNTWETDEDLIEKVDAALSEVVSELPENAQEPSKTVYGVPASWVEDGKIKKAHLEKIRLVSQKLSLTPTGFVVLPEAIAHGVKIREGSPLSGVIVGVGVGSLDLTLVRLGNIVGTVSVGRSVSLTEDVVEGLSRFPSSEAIPTRWLLYDGQEVSLEEVKQELIKTDWKDLSESLKILHTPQVDIVTSSEKAEAVSIAGASELSEITGVEGDDSEESNFEHTEDLSPEDLGFVVDADISEVHSEPLATMGDTENLPDPLVVKKKPTFSPLTALAPVMGIFKKLKKPAAPKLPHVPETPTFAKRRLNLKKLKVLLPVALVLILGGLIAAWIYLPRATITIHISPKNLQDSEVITLSEDIETADVENFEFPAESVQIEVTSEKTASATGVKTVGDPARGSVTIRNGTAEDLSFDAGDTLSGQNDLKFTLDSAVDVPKASSPTTPGSASVAATAADIGGQYNLAKDETFSVRNYPKSDVDAVAESDFSGGSSREITAISASDISGLKEDLESELEDKARERLASEAGSARFVPESVTYEITDESSSGKAGDEAGSVSYTMSMSARGLVLPKEQVEQMSLTILKDQIPEGFALRGEQVTANFDLIDEIDTGVWEFDVTLSANLLPSVDTDAIKKEVLGKRPDSIKDFLSQIPGYSRAVVTLQPVLPGILNRIPTIAKNVTIEVLAEQ